MSVTELTGRFIEKGMAALDKRTPTFALLSWATYGIKFSSQTEAALDSGAEIIEQVDHLFDSPETAEQREQALDELASILGFAPDHEFSGESALGPAKESAIRLRALVTPEQAAAFFATGLETIKITSMMRETETVSDFAALRRRESQLTRMMLFSLISDEDRTQPKFAEYQEWITGYWAMGNLLDSAYDLPSDFLAGLSKIPPTLENRLRLLGHCLIDSKDTFAYFGIPRSVRILKKMLTEQKQKDLFIKIKQA